MYNTTMRESTTHREKNILYYVFAFIAVVYVASLAFTNFINWNYLLSILEQYDITVQNSRLVALYYNVRLTNDIIYPGVFFKLIFTLLTLFGLWAGFILSRGRNLIESIGLFWFYTIPRPNYFWGRITDQITGQVLPFCRIKVESIHLETGKVSFVTESLTDLFGRYRINFVTDSKHTYVMKVINVGYKIFEKKIRWDLDNNATIYNDIQLIPENSKSAGMFRRFIVRIKTQFNAHIVQYLYFISIISFLFVTFGVIREVNWGTTIYFVITSLALTWNTYIYFIHNKKHYGRFIFKTNGEPGNNILVNIYKDKRQMGSAMSNAAGEINFNVEPGHYQLTFLSSGITAEDDIDNDKFIDVQITNKGFLAHDVFIRNSGDASLNQRELANPFA